MKKIKYFLITAFFISFLTGFGDVKLATSFEFYSASHFGKANWLMQKKDSLIISKNEFSRLTAHFEKIDYANTSTQLRIELLDYYKGIIFIYQDTEFTEAKKNSFSINQIDSIRSQIKSNNPLFKIKFRDVLNEKRITTNEIQKLQKDFRLIYKRLRDINNNPLYKFEKDGVVFYKVPEATFYIED